MASQEARSVTEPTLTTLHIPTTLLKLHQIASPWSLGYAIGKLLYHIAPLVSMYLECLDNHHGETDNERKLPSAIADYTEYIDAITQFISEVHKFEHGDRPLIPPNPHPIASPNSARRTRRLKRRLIVRITHFLEAAYKRTIYTFFQSIISTWSPENTQLFNKGVDGALSGVQWRVYPVENVVVMTAVEAEGGEEGQRGWRGWLRGRCEVLGMWEWEESGRALDEI